MGIASSSLVPRTHSNRALILLCPSRLKCVVGCFLMTYYKLCSFDSAVLEGVNGGQRWSSGHQEKLLPPSSSDIIHFESINYYMCFKPSLDFHLLRKCYVLFMGLFAWLIQGKGTLKKVLSGEFLYYPLGNIVLQGCRA